MAYCIGPVLHKRPSASFLIAASTSSRRGVLPTTIHPARQPGARYAFERLENEMIGASRSRVPRSFVPEIAVHLVGEDHETVRIGKIDECPPCARGVHRAGWVIRID
jgi:hypothetical protein